MSKGEEKMDREKLKTRMREGKKVEKGSSEPTE